MSIKVDKSTNIRPECNFCFDNKSQIHEIKGKGFLVISICEKCLEEINKQTNISYTEKDVKKIAKEAIGLWRNDHDTKLYQSKKYFGDWIKRMLKK